MVQKEKNIFSSLYRLYICLLLFYSKLLSLIRNITFQKFQCKNMLSVFYLEGVLIYLFISQMKKGEVLFHAICSVKLNCCHSWYLILTLQVLMRKGLSSVSY